MSWILIGVIGGSIIVSAHDSKEACLGRKASLDEQKIAARCVEAPSRTLGGVLLYNGIGITQQQ
jgi:hypothetical protein